MPGVQKRIQFREPVRFFLRWLFHFPSSISGSTSLVEKHNRWQDVLLLWPLLLPPCTAARCAAWSISWPLLRPEQLGLCQEDMHQLPQDMVDGDLHFLHNLRLLGRSHEEMVHRGMGSHGVAVPTSQGDGEQPHLLRDPNAMQYILVWFGLGDGYGNVLRLRQVPELIGEYIVPTVALREASEGGNIVGEGNRWEGSLPNRDRMEKLNGNVLGICTTAAIAKSDEFSPLVKPLGHIVAGQGNSFGLIHQGKACHPSSLKCVGCYLRECSHKGTGAGAETWPYDGSLVRVRNKQRITLTLTGETRRTHGLAKPLAHTRPSHIAGHLVLLAETALPF